MTDNTTDYTGTYGGGIKQTCILNEGAITVATSYDGYGTSATSYTFASELYEGNYVAICNDSACTASATGVIPVMELPVAGEGITIGKIISTPQFKKKPSEDADANTLAERLAGKYYRVAIVEIMGGITSIQKATVIADGSNACVPGVGTTLKLDVSECDANGDGLVFDSVSTGGTGVIPFHYVSGTDGDTYDCLVGVTGMFTTQA